MSILFLNDLDKVCRGCLGKNGEMRPLFGSFLDNMLRTVAEIEVLEGDGLPQLMCVPCVLQVSRAFTFKQQCQRSDSTLRSFFLEMSKSPENEGNMAIDLDAVREMDDVKDVDVDAVRNVSADLSSSIPLPLSTNLSTGIPSGASRSTISNTENRIKIEHNQSIDVSFESHSDVENIDNKCLLIVHSVPTNIMTSELSNQIDLSSNTDVCIGMETQEVISPNEGDYITASDIIDGSHSHNGGPTMPTEHMYTDLKSGLTIDDNMLNDDDIDADILTDHFDSYSSKEDDSQGSISNQKTDGDDILELFQSHSNDDKLDMQHSSFQCNVCHKIFAENKILKRHLKIHNPNKPHVCGVCSMSFAESSNLTKHMKKHTGELRNVVGKPNLCSVCGKGFKWASSLSKHMKHHTKHKILTCPYCPKYYVEARSLNIHLRSHTGEKPFVCDICNKAFTQLGNLEKHVRVHTGEKPYECPVCKKAFSQSGYVAIHLRTHTGERPYICSECGKAFASSNTLAIHKRTHTGERPYSCNICNKAFARQETVVIHQRTHTGERPHVCTICNRGFASSGHLTGHMRSHTGEKTHECSICGKRLAGSSSLKVHMKTHEKMEIEELTNDESKTISIYECSVCNQNVTSSSYEHQIVDGVLICSNLNSIISHDNGDSNLIEEIHDGDGTDLILTTADDIHRTNEQQMIISLSELKEEVF